MGRPREPIVDRFARHVAARPSGCIEWTGNLSADGYGCFWVEGAMRRAHRISYALFAGDVGPGDFVLHLCHNRRCVNPEHLEIGDQAENQRQRRTCHCGECHKCRHREYMNDWSRRPENAARIRDRVSRRARATRSQRPEGG